MAQVAELPRSFRSGPTRMHLRQSDFMQGPVVVSESDVYVVFDENVEVDFPAPENAASPFHLGHFAALIVTGSRVVVDLRGKHLKMSDRLRSANRFMSLIDTNSTPLPPGKIGYTTPFVHPTDITIQNGSLLDSSHFGVHNVGGGARLLIQNVEFRGFEVGAISLSAVSDVTIRRCKVGASSRPKTSIEAAMLIDCIRECRAAGMEDSARRLAVLMASKPAPESADSLLRCIVISPTFNVGLPPLTEDGPRIKRIHIHDVEFSDVLSEPKETVGVSPMQGGEPVKDRFGNLVSYADAASRSFLAQTQAALTPDMEASVRRRLLSGKGGRLFTVHGLDLRGHELRQKASLFVRIDSADHCVLRDLRGGKVRSKGPSSAAVGYMLNACRQVECSSIRVDGVSVADPCVSTLSEERPQAGVLLRQCSSVKMSSVQYLSEDACACTIRDTRHVDMSKCRFDAPLVVKKVHPLHYRS